MLTNKHGTNVYTTHETKQPKVATASGLLGSSPNPSTETAEARLPVSTSNVSAQNSSSKQELVQLVEKLKAFLSFSEST